MTEQITIHQAMTKVMADVGAIGKNRRADQRMGGYAFRGIDDLYNALHDKLAAHGVFFAPEVLETEESHYSTSGGANMRLVRVTVRYTFYGPAGDSISAVTIGEAADTGDKAANKAMTAALKYLLFQVFCIATEDNEDADSQSPQLGNRQPDPEPQYPKLTNRLKAKAYEVAGEDEERAREIFTEAVGDTPIVPDTVDALEAEIVKRGQEAAA